MLSRPESEAGMAIESAEEFDPGPLCGDDCIAAGKCDGHTLYDLKRSTLADVPEMLEVLQANVPVWKAIRAEARREAIEECLKLCIGIIDRGTCTIEAERILNALRALTSEAAK